MGIIVAAVVCCVAGFFCPIFNYPNEDHLIITFLGALAAFVVISNYALMVEIRNKTKEDIELRQMDLSIMNQKIDALSKGYGVEEIAIRELFDYKKLSIIQFERRIDTYYVVYLNEKKPVFVKVTGPKEQKKAVRFSPKEYLDNIKDEETRKDKADKLGKGGFSKEDLGITD